MKTDKELLDEYHTEIMVQTCRDVPGADFTRANELYLELSERLTQRAVDVCPVCFGDKYLLHVDGLMHPCPACKGTGKRN